MEIQEEVEQMEVQHHRKEAQQIKAVRITETQIFQDN